MLQEQPQQPRLVATTSAVLLTGSVHPDAPMYREIVLVLAVFEKDGFAVGLLPRTIDHVLAAVRHN